MDCSTFLSFSLRINNEHITYLQHKLDRKYVWSEEKTVFMLLLLLNDINHRVNQRTVRTHRHISGGNELEHVHDWACVGAGM